jgi:ribosome biogenesis GTPase
VPEQPQPALPRVVAQHRGGYTVRTPGGEDRLVSAAGALRHAGQQAVVGDYVQLQNEAITAIEPRTAGVIQRGGDDAPLAANVDQAWIVTALGRDVNPRRVERYVALAAAGRVDPVVIVNKADLDPEPPLDQALGDLRAAAPGVPVLPVSAKHGTGLETLTAMLAPDRTAVLLGSSGAGKSTLTNALLGEDRQATHDVRATDEKGRHTTTRRELIELPTGGALIDTPGLRAVPVTAEVLDAGAFNDIDELAQRCRFADCTHTVEPDCAVRAAVEEGTLDPARLESYLRIAAEAGSEQARLQQQKRTGRIMGRAIRQMYRDREERGGR